MLRNLLLAFSFAKRDLKDRYVGMSFGELWYVISPLIMIFIYTVIFSNFMKMKLNIAQSQYAYSIYLVPGLLAWSSFSTLLNRVAMVFLEKAELLKKINVPAYSFMISVLIVEFLLFCISMLLGVGFLIVIDYPISWDFLYLLPVMLLQSLFAFFLGVILALFVPFFKDLKEIIPVFLQLWFWITPIVYVKEMIYDRFPYAVDYNIAYTFISFYQNLFLHSEAKGWDGILVLGIVTLILAFLSAYLYKKMVPVIKDII